MFSLEQKTAVVTGALGLLGREHCRALCEAGANVVVTDLEECGCVTFARELSDASGRTCIGVGANITDSDSVRSLARAALEKFASIDVLVNNAARDDKFESPAASAELSKFENYPLELWQKSLDVNVTGTFLCSQVIGTEMAKRKHGSIINVASTYGLVAPNQDLYKGPDGVQSFFKSAAYPTTKGAVIAFTRFLSAYWGRAGVRVNALCPGGVENAQDPHFVSQYALRTPLGRMARASDYQGAVVFLASDESSYMTGATLVVDGGWTAW